MIYYHGAGRLKRESKQTQFTKYHGSGKFFTKHIEEAKFYGPIVEEVDISPQKPYVLNEVATMPGLEKIVKDFGLYKEYVVMREGPNGDMVNAEDWVFKKVKQRGYDAIVTPGWCIALNDNIVKRKRILKFDFTLAHFLNDRPVRYGVVTRKIKTNTVKNARIKLI